MSISCLWAHLGPIKVVMLTTSAQKNIILRILLRKSLHVDEFWRTKIRMFMICVTPLFYITIKINRENKCILKTDIDIPKVTPMWHGLLGCRLSLALSRLLWPSKYAVEMSISCLWAHLGPIKVVMLTTLAQKIIILTILMPKRRHLDDFSMKKGVTGIYL